MANIHDILREQQILADKLTSLIKMVNLLLKEDLLRHKHTIDHYINQLENTRHHAELLNQKVDMIVEYAKKNAKDF